MHAGGGGGQKELAARNGPEMDRLRELALSIASSPKRIGSQTGWQPNMGKQPQVGRQLKLAQNWLKTGK